MSYEYANFKWSGRPVKVKRLEKNFLVTATVLRVYRGGLACIIEGYNVVYIPFSAGKITATLGTAAKGYKLEAFTTPTPDAGRAFMEMYNSSVVEATSRLFYTYNQKVLTAVVELCLTSRGTLEDIHIKNNPGIELGIIYFANLKRMWGDKFGGYMTPFYLRGVDGKHLKVYLPELDTTTLLSIPGYTRKDHALELQSRVSPHEEASILIPADKVGIPKVHDMSAYSKPFLRSTDV